MRRTVVAVVTCIVALVCVSCGPAAETDAPDTEPLPSEEPASAYEILSEAARQSRAVGGFAYTETLAFEYPELSVSAELQENRVQCSWNEAEAGTYREALRTPGTELFFESTEHDTDLLLEALGLEELADPERRGSAVYVKDGALCISVANGEGTDSGKACTVGFEEVLTGFLESEDREDGSLYVFDPAEVLENCLSYGSGIEEILRTTYASTDEDGGMALEVIVPGSIIYDNRMDISRYSGKLEDGIGVELKEIVLFFRTDSDGFLAEQKQKTRFSMNLIGEAYTEFIAASCVEYENPGIKPQIKTLGSDDFTEYELEELLSMWAVTIQ